MPTRSKLSLAVFACTAALAFVSATNAQNPWDPWVPTGGGLMDPETGTIWSDAFCAPTFCFNREQALAFADQLDQGGFGDWRVPSLDELEKACADGGGAALEAFYQNPEFANRWFWSTALQAKRWPIWLALTNCNTVSVGAGSTTFVLCARGPAYSPRGGGKKKCNVGGDHGALELFGRATDGCQGTPSIGANRDPVAGDPGFGLVADAAPPRVRGLLMLGDVRAVLPQHVLGVDLNVEPAGYFVVADVQSRSDGRAEIPLPIPITMRGAEVFAQLIWIDPACPPTPFSATRGLAIRVQ